MDNDEAAPARPPGGETTGQEAGAPAVPPAPSMPGRRRRAAPWIAAWVLAVVVIAGLVVPSVLATQGAGRAGADPTLRRMFPLEPGTTWVYATSTNGRDTGSDVEQVAGPALPVNLAPNTFQVTDRFENFLGSGEPRTITSTVGLLGDSVVRYGTRVDDFTPSDPPEVLLRLPLERGRGWTWRGTAGQGKGTTRSTVLEVAPRQVLGVRVDGCVHVRAEARATDSQGTPSTDVTETWDCPGIGAALVHEVFEKSGQRIVFDQTLTGFHSPDRNLGGPAATAGAAPGLGGTAGVDQGRSGFVPGARIATDRLAWSVSRRENILYPPVASGHAMILAEDDGTVSSTDVRTGQVRWQVTLTGPIVAPPVAAGGLVLVGDASKTLWALDAGTGAARWAARLPDVVSSSPVVSGDIVVVPSDDLAVRGLDLATGDVRWTASTSDLVLSPPVLVGGLVVLGSRNGNLTALRPADGSVAWTDSSISSFSGGTSLLGGLAAAGGVVVATTDSSTVYAYDAATGRIRWRSTEPHSVALAPAVAGDRVILVAESVVETRDVRTGKALWTRRVGTTVFAPPMVLGDTVAVLKSDDRLVLLALSDGSSRVVGLRSPEPGVDQDTQLPMAWVDGALVVPTHNLGPWPFTILQAYPAPAPGSSGRTSPAAGVRLAGRTYELQGQPTSPPVLDRGRLVAVLRDSLHEVVKGKGVDVPVGRVVEAEPLRGTVLGEGPKPTTLFTYRNPGLDEFAVPAGDRLLVEAGTTLVSLPRGGGRPAWSFDTGQLLPGMRPLVVGDTVVVPRPGVGLSGLDLATGKRRWPDVPVTAPLATGSPHLLPDGNVIWCGGGVTIVDPRTGAVARSTTKLVPSADLAVEGGDAFAVASVGNRKLLVAIDTGAFSIRWAKPFTPAATLGGLLPIAPAAGSGVVVAVDAAHVLHAFDAADGTELWSVPLRLGPSSPPVVVDGRVYVNEPGVTDNLVDQHDDRVTVLDARTGAMEAVWELPGVNVFGGVFTASGGTILTDAPSGTYAIRPETR